MRITYSVVVVMILAGCDAGKLDSTSKPAGDSLGLRCAKEAVSRGYKAANCANGFIKTCIDTQSKGEMDFYYRQVDMRMGVVNSPNCPNITAQHGTEFELAYKQADTF